jgi:hypothetical protein
MPRQAGSTRSITFMPSSSLGPPEKRALWIVGQRSSALCSGPSLTGGRPLPAWSPASRYHKLCSGWLVGVQQARSNKPASASDQMVQLGPSLGPSDLLRLYCCICRSAFSSSSPVIGRGSSVSLRSSCRRLIVSAWRLANRRGTSCSSWRPSRQQPCQAILLSACPWQRTVPRTVVKDITFVSAQRQSRTSSRNSRACPLMSFSFEFVQTFFGSTTCALVCMGSLQPPVRIHKDFDVLKLASRTAGLVARSK